MTAHVPRPVDPTPAKALHSDLLSRFKSLNGTKSEGASQRDDERSRSGNEQDSLAEEDGKTVEELLAELGPEDAWNIEKDESTQIEDLLRSANDAMKNSTDQDVSSKDLIDGNSRVHNLPNIDVVASHAGTNLEENHDSEDEQPRKSKKDLENDIDREADDIIARLKDELKNAPPNPEPDPDSDEESSNQKSGTDTNLPPPPSFDLPTIPSKDPTSDPTTTTTATATDTDLASRFASLSLPTAPSSNPLPSAPSIKPGTTPTKFGSSARYSGHTNEDIDSWCIICLEDATLRCLGCDGDLYCAKCWVEGHRGPDAGYEERTHKAVQYNVGGGVKKERRKVAA